MVHSFHPPHLEVSDLFVCELIGYVQQLSHVVVPLFACLPGTRDASAAVLLPLVVVLLARGLHADKVALVAKQKRLH